MGDLGETYVETQVRLRETLKLIKISHYVSISRVVSNWQILV